MRFTYLCLLASATNGSPRLTQPKYWEADTVGPDRTMKAGLLFFYSKSGLNTGDDTLSGETP